MKSLRIIAAVALIAALAACNKNSVQQMADAASNIGISCTPELLTVVNGAIPVTVKVDYPAGYFAPESKLAVTPVLVYEGGEAEGPIFRYQGSKVRENNKVIPADGGSVTESFSIPYVDAMKKCYLELRSIATYKDKSVRLPARKVADGVVTTGSGFSTRGYYDYKEDGYQHVITKTSEGQIHYDVNSSSVKSSELNSASFREYTNTMAEIADNDRAKVKDVKIISYASPEGGEERNAKLSSDRSTAAKQAWDKVSKELGAEASPEVRSVGQDWEGFQEAVAKSDIEDKDLILRVLSMYNDPEVRESEIRNMSQIFTELKKEVLPELRRSRFVTEVEYENYSDEELHDLADRKRLYFVDETALLRIAATSEDPADKALFYRAAAERFGSQAGRYNLAIVNLDQDSHAVTELYLGQLKNQKDPDVLNARGVIEIRRGNYDGAAEYFEKAGNESARKNLGIVALANGDYATAARQLKGAGDVNEAIADIMAGDLKAASAAIEKDTSALADYYRAVIAARSGKKSDARYYLDSAFEKDASLREKALKDIEFVAL
ncbi:MAG: hypothetical protein IJ222_09830 [Bacteroidales bacterium]|nr:hypothetical protein [Bacteroidales bacterium]